MICLWWLMCLLVGVDVLVVVDDKFVVVDVFVGG